MSIAVGLMSIVAASAWAQASTDSIEAEGVRFGTGASIGTITEKMRITQAGLVGIGTSAPSTSLYVNGQIGGGFGAMSTSGVLDWNDISNARSGNGYTLLRSSTASNAPIPGSSAYFHPFSFEYNAKDGGNNLTQFAIPYTDNGSIGYGLFYRGRYAGSWSGWHRLVVTTTSNTTGINTITPTAALDVVGNVSVTGIIDVGHTAQACATAISGSIRYETVSDTLQICTSAGWKSLASSTIASGGSTSAASSTGAIQFNSGNSFAGDTDNLFWDDTNNRLGVGTASPQVTLQVSGSFVVSTSAQAYTSPSLYVDTMGRVSIGQSVPTGILTLTSHTAALTTNYGFYSYLSHNPATTPNAHYRGLYLLNDYTSAQDATSSNSVRGGEFIARSMGTGDISYTYGLMGYGQGTGGSSMYGNTGVYGMAMVSNSTTSTYLYGAQLLAYDYNGPGVGGVNTGFGALIQGYSNAGRMTNYYGLYVNSFSGIDPTGDFYGIYQADGAMDNYFAGNVGIGVAAPNSKLEVNGAIATQGNLYSLRHIYGNYGFMHYQDGSNYYMLVTNSGDQYGTYNGLRPFYVNLASGGVTLGAGALYAQHGGNVGIGTSSPNARLDVNGVVSASAIIAAPPMMILADEKAATTDGGTCTSGSWFTRVLNTTRSNTISGASLSSNQFTLPAGDFIIQASSPGFNTDRNQARLYNVTDAAAHTYGSNAYSNSAASYAHERSNIVAKVSIAASKVFRIEFRCQTSKSTNGLGVAGDWGTEVYTLVEITQTR